MSANLKTVKLGEIRPNPWRDGKGGNPPATWESVAEEYGFLSHKIEELRASIRRNDLWHGVIVRAIGNGYELAFGHHRVEAARQEGMKDIPVIVEELSDDQMLQRMACENNEEYGNDFALSVMNPIEALVHAYGAGKIELQKPDKVANKSQIRYAPSFMTSHDASDKPYTAREVGVYLGWTAVSGRSEGGQQAAQRVLTALSALELIEKTAVLPESQRLTKSQFRHVGSVRATELVREANARWNKALAEADRAHAKKHEEAERKRKEAESSAKKAKDEESRLKAEQEVQRANDELEKIEQESEKKAAKEMVSATKTMHHALMTGSSINEAKSETEKKHGSSGNKKTLRSVIKNLTSAVTRMLPDGIKRTEKDGKDTQAVAERREEWREILKSIASGKNLIEAGDLLNEIRRLSSKANSRAEELSNAIEKGKKQ